MSKQAEQKNQRFLGDGDVPDILLGKRHESVEPDAKELVRTAQTLGFSAKEILELERLYQAKSKS